MVFNPPSAGACSFIHFGMAHASYLRRDSNTGRPEQRSAETVMEHTLMGCLRRYLGEKEKQKNDSTIDIRNRGKIHSSH